LDRKPKGVDNDASHVGMANKLRWG